MRSFGAGALHVKADGSLEGLSEIEVKPDAAEIALAEAILLAQLLELLVSFIGPILTRQLIKESWPKADLDDLEI